LVEAEREARTDENIQILKNNLQQDPWNKATLLALFQALYHRMIQHIPSGNEEAVMKSFNEGIEAVHAETNVVQEHAITVHAAKSSGGAAAGEAA